MSFLNHLIKRADLDPVSPFLKMNLDLRNNKLTANDVFNKLNTDITLTDNESITLHNNTIFYKKKRNDGVEFIGFIHL